jgi:hypothetical protein
MRDLRLVPFFMVTRAVESAHHAETINHVCPKQSQQKGYMLSFSTLAILMPSRRHVCKVTTLAVPV